MNVTFVDDKKFSDRLTGPILIDDRESPYNYIYNVNKLTINYNDMTIYDEEIRVMTTFRMEMLIEKEILKHMVYVRKLKLDKI